MHHPTFICHVRGASDPKVWHAVTMSSQGEGFVPGATGRAIRPTPELCGHDREDGEDSKYSHRRQPGKSTRYTTLASMFAELERGSGGRKTPPNLKFVKKSLVQALRPLGKGLHRLLDLPFVRLVQDGNYDLFDPHPHLPALALLLLVSPAF